MNERIKQLAEQAGYTKDIFGVGHWDMPECKKFAELIVQECAKVADIADENKCEWIGGNILTHFGVEDRAVPILSADEQALFAGIASSKLFTIEGAKKQFGVEE